MRYVVTGGAGFIGSHLVEHLLSTDHDVVVLDDFSTGHRDRLAPMLDRIELVEGSIVDPKICERACRGADYVLHQAALPSVPRSVAEPATSHAVNATGTLNVLIAARDAGVRRVVYAASSSAYGDVAELPKREDMATRPRSPYAVAKLTGEEYCRAFHASYGFEAVALRYFNVFGPRQDPKSQYAAVVPRFITAARLNRAPTIFGDGEQTRDFTYIDNVVQANMLACQAEGVAGQVFNIGCGERITVNTLWAKIAELTGSTARPHYEPSRQGDVRDSLASLEKASRLLKYAPKVTVDAGLERTCAAFAASSVSASAT
jgi:nucleoside-diphosphate-sugar epimerase